jgi:hypothetical protein
VNEALAGDLLEEYRRGRSALWYWKQVLTAIAVGQTRATRSRMRRAIRTLTSGWTVQFYPRRLLGVAVFAGILILAVNTRAGNLDPTFLVVGVIAYLAIESLVITGPAWTHWLSRRTGQRRQ